MIRRWVRGSLVGLIVGVGSLIAGPTAAVLGLLAAVLVASRPPREAPVAGLTIGLWASWLAVVARADLACQADCVGPDLRPWYAAAIVFVVIGLSLTIRVAR